MKALGAGRLLNAETSSFGMALTPAQCIQYALDRPAVSSVLLGAKTVEEMQRDLAFENASAEEKDYTCLGAGTKSAIRGKCMYCNHCLPCPAGIDIAAVNKFRNLAQVQGEIPETVREHYRTLAHHASECIACGRCQSNCPFGVDIIGHMRLAAAKFGY